MSEATNRMDLNVFARMVNLNANQAIAQVQELAKAGFLRKVGSGYGVTEKGKAALKASVPVPKEMGFHFYTGIGVPTGLIAQTLEEFYRFIKQVSTDSLEFHLYRRDFEKWLRDVLKNSELAEEIGNLKMDELKSEDLRKELLKAIDAKYGIEELS